MYPHNFNQIKGRDLFVFINILLKFFCVICDHSTNFLCKDWQPDFTSIYNKNKTRSRNKRQSNISKEKVRNNLTRTVWI